MNIDLTTEALGVSDDGRPVLLAEVWPSSHEVAQVLEQAVDAGMFRREYANVTTGDDNWRSLEVPTESANSWMPSRPMCRAPVSRGNAGRAEAADGRHRRESAGCPRKQRHDGSHLARGIDQAVEPAGLWLQSHGVTVAEFNSYGARRGNHEVMIRGTFANPRIRNRLVPGTEGGVTVHLPDGEQMTIFEAAVRYQSEGVPLVVIAGKEYGSGSSRDWAAKGPALLGVRAVIAESFERIHRSNLIGMGVLPLQFANGESAESLGLTAVSRST